VMLRRDLLMLLVLMRVQNLENKERHEDTECLDGRIKDLGDNNLWFELDRRDGSGEIRRRRNPTAWRRKG
jgi:hypothetical protein